MKLLYVISDRNVGGAGIQLLNVLRHLDRRAFSATVALPFQSRLRPRLLAMQIPVCELVYPCDVLSAYAVCESVALIRREQPDIVHTNAAVAARVAGRLTGKRVVFTRHCAYPEQASATPLSARLANRLLTDRAVATAQAAASDLRAMGVPKQAITVIPNGSDPVREVRGAELAAWRKRLGLPEDAWCVGICARLERCKRHEVFLRAARRLLDRPLGADLHFLIVGEGSRRPALERLCAELGLAERVHFTGFVQDVAPLYRLMRVHVNTSCGTETSCLAISEAMSAGVPSIVSDYGGNVEMIGESKAGAVVPCGDACALADAIEQIVTDPQLEGVMRAAARSRYLRCFTAERMTEQLMTLYRTL